jgi:acetyltransferase-like isoleucine patch superfamily enzyme
MNVDRFGPALLGTPWKIALEIRRIIALPYVRASFMFNGVPWQNNWKVYGYPILQRCRGSIIEIGDGLIARSWPASNPLAPNRPVVISTRSKGAVLRIGSNFGITGGTICAQECIEIGNKVFIGANCIVVDTDFHPLDAEVRRIAPQESQAAPVVIEDEVFIGMNSMILKGVHIGRGSVIGAGSVVTKNVPAGVVFAGNPAQLIRTL